MIRALASLATLLACLPQGSPTAPKPAFQGDFFGEMPRAFCTILSVNEPGHTIRVKLDRDGRTVEVPVRDDTELHVRDSWGELSDYYPGQHVMLFMYVDDDHRWTYPRAIQDDIHMRARHNHFARVEKIDRQALTFSTRRDEKDSKGAVTKTVETSYRCAADAKVWKGKEPGGLDTLLDGDEVIVQLAELGGSPVAVEILDRTGDLAVRARQDERHREVQNAQGLPAYVTDVEVLSGSLLATVAWSASERARAELKPGLSVAVAPSGGKPFAAAVASVQAVDTRQRLQFVINARVASRLSPGQSLRIFLPGTGPAVPEGRAGIPAARK